MTLEELIKLFAGRIPMGIVFLWVLQGTVRKILKEVRELGSARIQDDLAILREERELLGPGPAYEEKRQELIRRLNGLRREYRRTYRILDRGFPMVWAIVVAIMVVGATQLSSLFQDSKTLREDALLDPQITREDDRDSLESRVGFWNATFAESDLSYSNHARLKLAHGIVANLGGDHGTALRAAGPIVNGGSAFDQLTEELRFSALVVLADAHVGRREWTEALSRFGEALEIDDGDWTALIQSGVCNTELGNTEEAIRIYNGLVEQIGEVGGVDSVRQKKILGATILRRAAAKRAQGDKDAAVLDEALAEQLMGAAHAADTAATWPSKQPSSEFGSITADPNADPEEAPPTGTDRKAKRGAIDPSPPAGSTDEDRRGSGIEGPPVPPTWTPVPAGEARIGDDLQEAIQHYQAGRSDKAIMALNRALTLESNEVARIELNRALRHILNLEGLRQ